MTDQFPRIIMLALKTEKLYQLFASLIFNPQRFLQLLFVKSDGKPFLQFMRQAVPEFGSFLLNEVPEIDQKAFFQENAQWFLRQLPGVKAIFFVDVATEAKADVPADLWDDNFAAQSQVYIPTATLCVRE